jgi:pimeloyl-ACP methyl ester carboxylesterase
LPSVGATPHLKSFDADVDAVRAVINNVLSSGKDAVILYHSYGGVVGSEALSEYLKELGDGDKKNDGVYGQVRRLIYCSAFALPAGASLMLALNNQPLPWFVIDVCLVLLPSPRF